MFTAVISTAGAIAAGAAAITLGAWVSLPVPGAAVPQTGQTLAVLLVGCWAGHRRGSAAVALYLLLGAAGAGVFAGGASGLPVLGGPGGGFLMGFLPAAALAGFCTRTLNPWSGGGFLTLGAVLLLAHGLILLCGWGWLSVHIGPADAFRGGVAPFLAGALMKSLIAAVAAALAARGLLAYRNVTGREFV